jgi:hypothetical protein
MRGRNNRKGPNPLTRTYESNGPDVKIRGTAHHVAEKYLQLARDAQSSGDPVMAESYLQHAEHYFRLIASAQLAQAQAQMGYVRAPGEPDMDEMDDDDDMGGLPDRFASPPERLSQPPQQQGYGNQQQPYGQPSFGGQQPQQQPMAPPNQPQPFIDRPAFGGERQHGQPYQGERQPRPDRPFQDRQDRPERQDRNQQDRNQNGRNRFNDRNRENRQPREFRNDQPQPQQPPREAFREPRQEAPEVEVAAALPSFITSPVRVMVPEPEAPQPIVNAEADQRPEGEVGGYHLRPRRRRKRPEGEATEAGAQGDLPIAE